MKAKRVISIFLVGAAAVSLLTGCGSGSGNGQNSTDAAQEDAADTETATAQEETQPETAADSAALEESTASTEETETEESSSDTADAGNVLVVYYSATGNTEEVANIIAETTGGDLFELVPEEPYTSEDLDWTNDDSRVSVEHANEDQRDVALVSTDVENWDSYDTVFVGYPIWLAYHKLIQCTQIA